jgi:hypothetical protein
VPITDQQKEFLNNFKEYLETVAIPTVDEFLNYDTNNLRRARLACIVLAHARDYVKILYASLGGSYKSRLDQLPDAYNLINDICDATKHSILRSQNRNITKASDVSYHPHEGLGMFDAPFGSFTFNNEGVYAMLQNGKSILISEPLKQVVRFFINELEYTESTILMKT